MINWYRAAFQHAPPLPANRRIKVPTLVIWGMKDFALGSEMAQSSVDLCDDGRLVLFDDAGHWVQHDKADAVNALLKDFFV
jgi:pimeloyl-ACP methyl ester carboxylesterase